MLKNPTVVTPGWDYICFTDNMHLTSDVWQIVQIVQSSDQHLENKKRAMLIMIEYYKYVPKNYDIVLSVGGQITINCHLGRLVEQVFTYDYFDLAICTHPSRTCIYDEALACKQIQKDHPEVIDRHISRYQQDNFPKKIGLYSTGMMIRRNHSVALRHMCAIWGNELRKGSRRDQLSLNYAIWKATKPLRINELMWKQWMSRSEPNHFIIGPHKQEKIEKHHT